jgi:hypothetical protein
MAKDVKIEILKDGVFIADDVRCAKGAVQNVPSEIADALVDTGHAKRK